MSKIRICADSTCDLSPELIEKYNITITPLQIFLGDKDYTDQKRYIPADNIRLCCQNGNTPENRGGQRGNIYGRFHGTQKGLR